MGASPIPTYTTLGSHSETATAPTEPVLKNPSDTLNQFMPPSSDFQTPPPVAPK